MIGRIVRAIISIIVGIIPLLYLGGYLSAFGLPSPYSGATGGTNFLGFSFPFAAGSAGNSLVPIAGFGITGLIIFTVLSRIGSMSSSMISQPRMPDMSQIPLFSGMQQGNIPESVPDGLSKTQFVILRQLKAGGKEPKGNWQASFDGQERYRKSDRRSKG